MPIDQLWARRRQKQSTSELGRVLFSGGSKDWVSIVFLYTPGQNEPLTHTVWAQPHCMEKQNSPGFFFYPVNLQMSFWQVYIRKCILENLSSHLIGCSGLHKYSHLLRFLQLLAYQRGKIEMWTRWHP